MRGWTNDAISGFQELLPAYYLGEPAPVPRQ